jgi:hypothetical protein
MLNDLGKMDTGKSQFKHNTLAKWQKQERLELGFDYCDEACRLATQPQWSHVKSYAAYRLGKSLMLDSPRLKPLTRYNPITRNQHAAVVS